MILLHKLQTLHGLFRHRAPMIDMQGTSGCIPVKMAKEGTAMDFMVTTDPTGPAAAGRHGHWGKMLGHDARSHVFITYVRMEPPIGGNGNGQTRNGSDRIGPA